MDETLSAAVRAGVPVVTASRRLARTLQRQYSQLQYSRGAKVWEAPTLLPWAAWLETLWEEFQFRIPNPPVRLDVWQERALWESIVRGSPLACELLRVAAAALAVQRSWTLAIQWRLDLARVESEGTDDARAFTKWAKEFAETCDSRGWVDAARMPDRLCNSLGGVNLPSRVLLAGFDDLTPQQTELIDACRSAGCELESLGAEPLGEAGKAVRVPFADREQEIIAAARWTRNLLETNPRTTIGIVIPDLATSRAAVERVFRAILEPDSELPGAGTISRLVNLSAGKRLARYPVVNTALAILALSRDRNEWDGVSSLVRDRYIDGCESELTARGFLDARLRELGRMQFSLADVRKEARVTCPSLDRVLQRWLKVCEAAPAGQTAAQWALTFTAMLDAMGWPGEQPLNSVDYQTVEAFKKTLSTFAGTGFVTGEMTVVEAVSWLTRIAAEMQFQPESPDAPIQILGALETAGLRFDHLWVARLDDESWPGPPSPDPFLPIRIQREADVPRCSPDRELAFAVLITHRFLASSPDIVLSYPAHDGDRDLSPSPLILPIPVADSANLPSSRNLTCADAIREARALEQVFDEHGPPLKEEAWQRGGTKVFEYQAACPFRAFVELRLGAEDLEAPGPGLNARQRGSLVHVALEEFWNDVRTHEALCNRTDITDVVQRAVASALTLVEERRGSPLPERFAAMERRRLERLITEWLELEKRREPFEVIKPEGEREAELGGIHFKVKIDRVDRIADDRDVIIDYKTGSRTVKSWETERPEEPQLPLYSVVYRERPLAGVLFGQLKTGELKFKGLVDGGVVIPGADSGDLAARITEWRSVLERLAAEFRSGHAEADPKAPDKTCRYCSLACLCRIAESDAYWNLEAE